VFENHLHFLPLWIICPSTSCYHKSWFQSFVISSSLTSILSCCCLIFHSFFSFFQNRTCNETPLQVEVHEIIFPTSHHMHETGSEQESCANFTPAMQSVQSDFRRATLNVSTTSPCTGLQNWWFLMRWKEGLKELLNINFSFILHLLTRAQILMETTTSFSSLVGD
jgi:hypothetical protein